MPKSILCLVVSIPFLTAHVANAAPLDQVQSWGYQLQENQIEELAASQFDLIVMDYSSDGGAQREFNAEQIQTVKDSGKKVISYLSIGEAEDYRFYFKSNWIKNSEKGVCSVRLTDRSPVWLELPNRDFCGNFKVRFWNKRWQRKIFGTDNGSAQSYLDRIIEAGFDGVYLDIIDGYEYWLNKPKAKRRKTAASDMAKLVIAISNYARNSKGLSEFIVIPQNGAGILNELSSTERSAYLNAIDGIGAEDTYYFGDADEDNPLDIQEDARSALLEFKAAGKKVFAIDYLTDSAKINDFAERACSDGFIPQVGLRDLATLEAQQLLGCEN